MHQFLKIFIFRFVVRALLCLLFFTLTWGHTYWFLEREGGEREGEKHHVRGKHWSVASHTHPDGGLNPQRRCVPWQGIKSATLPFAGRYSTKWATVAGAFFFFFCFKHSITLSILFSMCFFGLFLAFGFEYQSTNRGLLTLPPLIIFLRLFGVELKTK